MRKIAGEGRLGTITDDSGHFYKPLLVDEQGTNEVSFYTSFSSNTKIPQHITRFFPKFDGTQLMEASDGSGMKPHLILQDLTFQRANPSVMDIKIGLRMWAPHSNEDYIHKCLKKDRATSSISLGFRLSGYLKNFVSSKVSDSKPDCAFTWMVYGGSAGILSQLLELKVWFEDQATYHFYSCSILMMFEKELALNGKSPHAEIKLVDFAHVSKGKGIIDHNFLGWLCSLIKFISEILTTPEDSTTDYLLEDAQRNHIYSENGLF
ncbi:hypothetical protein ACS0TY_024333 [Phlomoides rotata]